MQKNKINKLEKLIFKMNYTYSKKQMDQLIN